MDYIIGFIVFVASWDANDWRVFGTLVIAVVATITLPITAWQVWQTRKQNRASILFQLERRWNTDLSDERKELWAFVDKIDAQARNEKPGQRAEVLRAHSEELFPAELEKMEKGDPEKYLRILQTLGFVEITAYIAKRRYLRKKEIINLFGGALLGMRRVFFQHIKKIQEEPGSTGRAWANSEWLFNKIEKVAEKLRKKRQ